MNRRKLLKSIGISIGGTIISTKVLAKFADDSFEYVIPPNPLHKPVGKPVTAITLGAGNRGTVYGNYAANFPASMKIVGVAEPNKFRNDKYAKTHSIPDKNRFDTWEQVFQQPKFADAIIISTPDRLHYGPCMKALQMGYDVLLEKPIAPTEKECRNILELSKKTGRIVPVPTNI